MGKLRRFLFPFLVLLFQLVVFSDGAMAAEQGTIVLKSGERIENVNFEINKFYKIVTIIHEDSKRNISFSDISTILDKDGNNVTVEIIGGYYKRSEEKWESESSPQYKKSRSKPWAMALRLGGNYSIPLGNYYEGIDPGFGYEGDLILGLTRELSLRFTVSRSGMALSDKYAFYSIDPAYFITNQKTSINAMRYLLSLEYQKYKYEFKPGRSYFYGITGIGLVNHGLSAEIWYTWNGDPFYEKSVDNVAKFMTTIGIGGGTVVAKNVALDLGAVFEMVFVGADEGGYAAYAYILDLNLGVLFYIQ